MMDATSSLDHLLANAAWARRLARRLTRNPEDAEDLVQDALLASMERPSAPTGATRPWLGAILGNLFRSTLRSTRRRDRREQSVGMEPVHAPEPEETLAALEVHRMLAQLVAELPEPYRQTLVLRYFEERSAAEIAAQAGIPAGTVRWRLKTGLDQLRARLDERQGGRKAWLVLLVRFGGPGERRVPAPPRSTVLPLRLALTAIATGAVVAGGLLLLRRPSIGTPASLSSASTVAAEVRPGSGPDRPAALATITSDQNLVGCIRRFQELRHRERALLMELGPKELYESGVPNEAAQIELRSVLDRALAPLEHRMAGHALDCRAYACRLLILMPDPRPNDLFFSPEQGDRAGQPGTRAVDGGEVRLARRPRQADRHARCGRREGAPARVPVAAGGSRRGGPFPSTAWVPVSRHSVGRFTWPCQINLRPP
jgi:RNA polymerase sigma-70 factor (ECF subfamily)